MNTYGGPKLTHQFSKKTCHPTQKDYKSPNGTDPNYPRKFTLHTEVTCKRGKKQLDWPIATESIIVPTTKTTTPFTPNARPCAQPSIHSQPPNHHEITRNIHHTAQPPRRNSNFPASRAIKARALSIIFAFEISLVRLPPPLEKKKRPPVQVNRRGSV